MDRFKLEDDGARWSIVEGDERNGVLAREDDGGLGPYYPILGGVPVLMPTPELYLTEHRDAVLAALAEEGLADGAAVALLRQLTAEVRGDAPTGFRDDWTIDEATGDGGAFEPPAGEDGRRLGAFLDAVGDPWARVARALDGSPREVLEIGPGAGVLTEHLGRCGHALWLVDANPRALFTARRRVGGRATIALADAEQLPFGAATFDAVVAANVIDLLTDPRSLLDGAARALRAGGRLVLTTPDPWPWSGDEGEARALLEEHGLRLVGFADDLLWPRHHGPREMQLFRLQLVVGERG